MFLAPSPPEESRSEGGVLPHPRGWAGLAFLTPGMAPVGASPAGGGPGRVLLRRVHRAFSVPFLLGSLLPPSTFVRRDAIPLRRGQALCTLGPHGLGHLWVPASHLLTCPLQVHSRWRTQLGPRLLGKRRGTPCLQGPGTMEVSFWRLSARGVHQWFRAPGSTRLPGPGPFSMAVGGQRRRGGQDRTECLWVWPGHPRNPSPAPQPPAPQCDILGLQGSGEVAKAERGHSGGSSSSQTGVLNEERGSGGRLAEGRPRERTGEGGGGGIHAPSREAAGGTGPAHASISGFQPPGLWGDAVP